MFTQARFEIALDRAQGAGLQILACVDRHGCAALSALDPQVGADLPDLDTSEFVEDAPQAPTRRPLATLSGASKICQDH